MTETQTFASMAYMCDFENYEKLVQENIKERWKIKSSCMKNKGINSTKILFRTRGLWQFET